MSPAAREYSFLDSIVENHDLVMQAVKQIDECVDFKEINSAVNAFYKQFLRGKYILVKELGGRKNVGVKFGKSCTGHLRTQLTQNRGNVAQMKNAAKQMIIAISKVDEILNRGKIYPSRQTTVDNHHFTSKGEPKVERFAYALASVSDHGTFAVTIDVMFPPGKAAPIGYMFNVESSSGFLASIEKIEKLVTGIHITLEGLPIISD
jgi:hypothetical protein